MAEPQIGYIVIILVVIGIYLYGIAYTAFLAASSAANTAAQPPSSKPDAAPKGDGSAAKKFSAMRMSVMRVLGGREPVSSTPLVIRSNCPHSVRE